MQLRKQHIELVLLARVLQARLESFFDNLRTHRSKGIFDRLELRKNFLAIGLGFNQARKPLDLPLDNIEPTKNLLVFHREQIYSMGVWGVKKKDQNAQ